MNNKKPNIRNCIFEEIENFVISKKLERFRSNQIIEWVWKKQIDSFSEMVNIPLQIRNLLAENYTLSKIKITTQQKSKDKTTKFGFSLSDNELIEGVLIPSSGRSTACISTQVGCPLGCKFCATGMLQFRRNLESFEITDQVILINNYSNEIFNRKLSNIVIMGMGEPLLNLNNVINSINIITSAKALGFSPQRITLSTAGLVEGIKKLADLQIKFNLAVSLHTANNAKRNHLMPVNKSNPLPQLIEALKYFYEKTKNRITFEYLMLNGFNDSLSDARELAEFCKNFPCKINLIEYNQVPEINFTKSTEEHTSQFISFLESKNLIVNLRKSKGIDIDAACGQLANKSKHAI